MRRIAIVAAITGIADGISRQRTKTSTDRSPFKTSSALIADDTTYSSTT